MFISEGLEEAALVVRIAASSVGDKYRVNRPSPHGDVVVFLTFEAEDKFAGIRIAGLDSDAI